MPINKQIIIKKEIFSNDRNFQDIILDYLIYSLNISNDDCIIWKMMLTSTCLRRSLLLTERKEKNV